MALIGVAVILTLFLFRPGANVLKNRIANAISEAVQRPVEIGSVHLHLLPSPGFDLDGFVVRDDPAFGAEPVLRASEVTANLRLTALLRAHLEISRLSLTEPSLNLVRNEQGHWNIESILQHTSQTAVGPTTRRASLGRPAFPYIEADRGRINFKIGPEKKPFALSDADYSFWQESDSSWGMRLKASPVRTDFNLSDTGILRVNGTWQRAGSLRETPLEFTAQWEGAQLGQVTKLISGADRGWRGTVRAAATVAGQPAGLTIQGDASIEDFRRYDLAGGDSLRLGAHCEARYSSVDRELRDIHCLSPMGAGKVSVEGDLTRLTSPASYDLQIRAEDAPMPALLLAARRAKKDLPADLQAEGSISFSAKLHRGKQTDDRLVVSGGGSTKAFRMRSEGMKTTLVLGEIPLEFISRHADERTSRPTNHHGGLASAGDAEPTVVIGPFHTASMPALAVRASLTAKDYALTAEGDGEIRHLMLAARAMGIPVMPAAMEGNTKVDLLLAGEWKGFSAGRVTGTAQIHTARIQLRTLNGPIEVATADVHLQPDRVEVQSITAAFADSRWKGSLSLPRNCAHWAECPISFDLQTDQIVPERLHAFADTSRPSPWYRVLAPASSAAPTILSQLRGSGKLKVGRLMLPNLVASHASSNLVIDSGHLRLSGLTAEVLGGKHDGNWEIDFVTQPPVYRGSGSFERVALAQLASAMRTAWITGAGDGTYHVEARGSSLVNLLGTASGSLNFDLRDVDLPAIVVEDGSLKGRRFVGTLGVRNGRFDLQNSTLDCTSGEYSVTGTATWSRQLAFTLTSENNPTLTVSGTLAEPQVTEETASPSRAKLQH